jgi:carboxylesterase
MNSIFTDRHKPIFLENKASDTAVLLVHGIYGSPVQFKHLSSKLHQQGYTVMAILLPGHGGNVDDFARVKAKGWHAEVTSAAAKLRKQYKNLILVGHSIGGLLNINEALKNGANGIVLMSVPMKVKLSLGTIKMSSRILWGNPDKDDDFLKSYREAYSIEKGVLWRYVLWLPRMIDLLIMIRKTRKQLCNVNIPTIIIQSRRDETVNWKSANILSDRIATCTQTLILDKSGHSYYHPDEISRIYSAVTSFIKNII